jgi:hypothetical protein
MIYTEYFVKGTQPTEECPLHQDRGFFDALAGVFGKDSGPPPVAVGATGATGATGLPAPPTPPRSSAGTASAPAQPAQAETEQAPAKKRGFWSRIFGRDKNDEKKDDDKKKEEQKKKSGG